MLHLNKVQKSMTGADALLVTSEINQRWISGFDYTDGYILVTREHAWLLADFRYIEAARAEVSDFEIVMPKDTMYECLAGIISANGINSIEIESKVLPVSDLESLKRAFPEVEFRNGASELLEHLREYKDSTEIEKIKAAQAVTDAAFEHILGYITPERTERDVALELEFFMRRHGAEAEAFKTIAVSGSASSMPHGVPRDIKLEQGFLTMDFGAKVDGYCSDMTRTVVIGKADNDMKRLYSTVLEAQTTALEAFFKGERGCLELDRIARDIIENAGYHGCFGHSLGHGVGMYIHENPRLAPRVSSIKKLKPGDVVTFEPGIYVNGKYGCRIEDLAAVTEDGGTVDFTKSPKHLIEL